MQKLVSMTLGLLVLMVRAQAGNVLVVAPTGAPFTDIQAAINTAANGDVVLVKSGTYAGFSIGDKSVSVVEDAGAMVMVQGEIHVGPAAASRTILLSGLSAQAQTSATSTPPALTADSIAGFLRVQECSLTGASASFPGTTFDGAPGARISNSPRVVISRCTLTGGSGLYGDVLSGPFPGYGGAGVACSGSNLALYDVTLLGGNGQTAQHFADGGNGGVGLDETSTTVFASHTTFTGGGAGNGAACTGSSPCWYGGNGGNAVHESSGSLTVLGCTFQGGFGGQDSACSSQCGTIPGTDMPGTVGGPMTQLPVPSRQMTCTEVVREQGQLTVTVTGNTGDQVGLFLSSLPDHQFVAPWNGVLCASTPAVAAGRLIRLGTIGGNGMLTWTFVYPAMGAGVRAETRFLQIKVLSASGSFVLGTPLEVVALDSGF